MFIIKTKYVSGFMFIKKLLVAFVGPAFVIVATNKLEFTRQNDYNKKLVWLDVLFRIGQLKIVLENTI